MAESPNWAEFFLNRFGGFLFDLVSGSEDHAACSEEITGTQEKYPEDKKECRSRRSKHNHFSPDEPGVRAWDAGG